MLQADHQALMATQVSGMNHIRMKEVELFSSQLGQIAAVGAFLSSNAFLGLIQDVDFHSDSSVIQVIIVYIYMGSCTIGFCSCSCAAVVSSFVMIWGTQKTFRGKKDEISDSVREMYTFRRSMIRLLIVGVLACMMMGATSQFAKREESCQTPFKIMITLVCIFFMALTMRYCRTAHALFKVDRNHSWETEAKKSLNTSSYSYMAVNE
ncbi:hypothetical protein TeGR_g14279 [Tetraparma gracilis]|uniref:Transmembrane protein n=1 Tax=Tetraparma gracilis TaxID=2962635 RepID=A0ABQ6N719_9STRA|nr:hypothetical protein TeGR_g14279 [Tetraparma gracilis]